MLAFWIKFGLAAIFGLWGYFGGREGEDSPHRKIHIIARRVAFVLFAVSFAVAAVNGTAGVWLGKLEYVAAPSLAFLVFWIIGAFIGDH